ncbi:MAG: methyl-viologen-reducing hydrogenase subunit delta [Thermoplasmata archaeon]|nr:MAG: methyl-viologen-reducing hydrogenase subunit delta [Thermoplasmata archaeon]
MAGTSRLKYPANVVPIKVMCSGRVDPEFIIDAFEKGADGVFIGGCHPGDCHYVNGNYRTRRRVKMMKKLLEEMGINPKRLRLEWVSATEGQKFARVIEEFVNEIKELGPSPWRK